MIFTAITVTTITISVVSLAPVMEIAMVKAMAKVMEKLTAKTIAKSTVRATGEDIKTTSGPAATIEVENIALICLKPKL
jgi:hypothetical protein